MTNPFYNSSGTPGTGSKGSSAPMRGEFSSIAAGFDKLPAFTPGTAIVVNPGGTALANTTGTLALGGNLTTVGAYATTVTATADAAFTLPSTGGTFSISGSPESFTYKTFDTAATGNVFKINGVTITAVVGTGAVVLASSPALVTPNLGTPSALTLTNATGLPLAGISGLGAGVSTFLSTPTSANLLAAVTDETGTGSLVFGNSPTLTTPILGVATVTSINKVTVTAPATGATLTIADGKTLTVSNNSTVSGTLSGSVSGTFSGTFSGTSSGTNTGDQTLPTWASLGGGSMGQRNVTIQSGGSPSGGSDGDVFFIY